MLIITSCSLKLSNFPVALFCSNLSETALLTVSRPQNFFSSVTLESVWWDPPEKQMHLDTVKLSWIWPSQYTLNWMGYLVLQHMVGMNHTMTNEVHKNYPISLYCIMLSHSFNLYVCVCPYVPVYLQWFCIHNCIYLFFFNKSIRCIRLHFTDV